MVLKIKEQVRKKLKAYSQTLDNTEIGGFLIGEKKQEDIIIKDIIILKQLKNSVHFEIDDEALMDFTKNSDSKTLSSIMGWWHSHHHMVPDWSFADDECFERLANLTKICVGVVVGLDKKDLEEKWKILIKTEDTYLSIDNIIPELQQHNFIINMGKIRQDITDNIMEGDYETVECNRCNGFGYLELGFKKVNNKKKKKADDIYAQLDDNDSWMNYVG